MPRKKKDKYVSDFVTIEDVCSCGVSAIWSGVGSGKNSFIEGVHEETANEDGTKNPAKDTELFSYDVNEGWTELESEVFKCRWAC